MDERKPVLATSINHGMIHMYMLILPQVLTLMQRDLSLGLPQMGVLANIAGLAFGFLALPAGLATDRFGAKRIIPLTVLGMAVFSFLIGIGQGFGVLALLFALLGICGGFYHPAGIALLSWAATRRGPAMGLHGIVGNIGFAIGPFLIGGIAAAAGWRASYLFMGLAGILVAAFVIWGLKGVGARPAPAGQKGAPQGVPAGNPSGEIGGLLLVCAIGALTGFVFSGGTLFLPTYLMRMVERTYLSGQALFLGSLATTIAYLMGVFGQYAGGQLSEKVRLDLLLMAGLVICVPLLVLTGLSTPLIILPSAMAFAFFHFMMQPVTNSLVAEFTPLRWRGLAYGIFFFSAYGIGSFASSFSAFIGERWGLEAIFFALAGISLLAALFSFPLLRIYRPRARAKAASRR